MYLNISTNHLGKCDEQKDKYKKEEQKSNLFCRDSYLVCFLLGFLPYESDHLLDLLGHIHIIHGVDNLCKEETTD